MFKKLTDDAAKIGTAQKTHAAVDASLLDLINPLVLPGDTTTALAKMAIVGVASWVGRGYRDTSSFSL